MVDKTEEMYNAWKQTEEERHHAQTNSEAGSSRCGGCHCAVNSGHQKSFITVQQHNN
jgi:hypothetical protein